MNHWQVKAIGKNVVFVVVFLFKHANHWNKGTLSFESLWIEHQQVIERKHYTEIDMYTLAASSYGMLILTPSFQQCSVRRVFQATMEGKNSKQRFEVTPDNRTENPPAQKAAH